MTAYPETNAEVIEKALYCLKHGEVESVENWLALLNERLTDKSRADALTDLQREAIKFAAGWFDQSVLPDTPYSGYADALRELLAASPVEQPAAAPIHEPTIPDELHPDTAKLVRRFARALANKLLAAQRKYGYSDNWMRDGWADECRAELMRHIQKGDPRDVAAYCAFLWHHNESTAPAPVDERAAFESLKGAWQSMPPFDVFCAGWQAGRAASANETGAPIGWAWISPTGHVSRFTADFDGKHDQLVQGWKVRPVAFCDSVANETGAEVAAVAWMRADDPRDCISDAKKRDMIEHAGAPGARLAEKYSIALGVITPAQAAEPVAWYVTWPGDPKETWCSVFVNERDAIQSASNHEGAEIKPLYAAPQPPAQADALPEIAPPQAGGNKGRLPALARTREGGNLYSLGYNRGLKKGRDEAAQAHAREGLTDEQRDVFGGNFGALEQAENLCRATGNDSSAEGLKALSHALHALLKGADHAE
ncbi:hypothetical protein LGN14_16075 [Burkholderia multivorans]|nr:hypothetical protein [Burkholderia multivorans]MCA8461309.1 hypothetical protein [Burkholderia multivorans]